MPAHVKEDTEAHLSLLAQKVPKLEDQIRLQGEQMKQQGDQIKELIEGLGRQDKILKVLCVTTSQAVPPVEFTVENIERLMDNNDTWYSPPFYSHLGGYKMRLRVVPRFMYPLKLGPLSFLRNLQGAYLQPLAQMLQF